MRKDRIITGEGRYAMGGIRMRDIRHILTTSKRRKAPGPGQVPQGLLTELESEALEGREDTPQRLVDS